MAAEEDLVSAGSPAFLLLHSNRACYISASSLLFTDGLLQHHLEQPHAHAFRRLHLLTAGLHLLLLSSISVDQVSKHLACTALDLLKALYIQKRPNNKVFNVL